MATDTWLQSKLRKSAGHVGYEIERLLIGINEEIVAQMEAKGITRTELARRLGVDKSYVTRMLNGMPNMTLKTLVSVASALDCRVSMPSFSKLTAGSITSRCRPRPIAPGPGRAGSRESPAAFEFFHSRLRGISTPLPHSTPQNPLPSNE